MELSTIKLGHTELILQCYDGDYSVSLWNDKLGDYIALTHLTMPVTKLSFLEALTVYANAINQYIKEQAA